MRYTMYRVRHELEKRTGFLKRHHPVNPQLKHFISLEDWRTETSVFVIPSSEKIGFKKYPNAELKLKASRILRVKSSFSAVNGNTLVMRTTGLPIRTTDIDMI